MDPYDAANLARAWARLSEETSKRKFDGLRWWERWLLRLLKRRFERVLLAFSDQVVSASLIRFASTLQHRLDAEETPTPVIRVTT